MDVAAAFWHARAWALCGRWLDPYIGVVAGVGDLVMGWMECWRLASYLTKTCSLDHHAFRSMAVAYSKSKGVEGGFAGRQFHNSSLFYRREIVAFTDR